ncbi:MAG: class I SAM-dependent methyltransferase [Gammaproteobacteria bacterium]
MHSEMRRGLHAWFSNCPGRWILEAELQLLNEILPNLFGYHLLQVGRIADADLLASSRILHRVLVDVDEACAECPYPYLHACPEALPIASDSIDVLVLPHTLEYASRIHDTLREAQRVLVPEGRLLILGFNPWSWFGVWRLFLRRRGMAPWRGRFVGLARMKDWLALLGFDEVSVRGHFFRPPFRNVRLMYRLQALERVGRHLPTGVSGAYLVVATKRVTTLTPAKLRWQPRRRLVAVGIAEPSARVSSCRQHGGW